MTSKIMSAEIYLPSFKTRALRVSLIFLGAVMLAFPFLYLDGIAGDALIHMIFAENAAQGNFFVFNPGEPAAGETSPAYMLIVALFYKLFGAAQAPVLMKALGFTCWGIFLALTYVFIRKAGFNKFYAYIGTLAVGLMPGSVHNALLGMENIIFADIVLIWIILAYQWKWFTATQSITKESIIGLIMAASVWLRPEAAPFMLLALSFRFFTLIRQENFFKLTFKSIICGAWTLALMALLIDWHTELTGHMPFGAGDARANLSEAQGQTLYGIPVNIKFTERLAFYFPLSILFWVGIWAFIKDKTAHLTRNQKKIVAFSSTVFLVFYVLYSTIFSSAHLARYALFLWPLMMLPVLIGVQYFIYLKKGKGTITLLALALISIYTAEGYLRLTTLGTGHTLESLQVAIEQREEHTNNFLKSLGATGSKQVVVAQEEVQMRYFYDDRIVMRSLDGILDTELGNFYADGYYDHTGYLKHRDVNFLLEYKNYNRDQSLWSLKNLESLEAGKMMLRDGILFTKLPSGHTAVKIVAE